MPDSERVKIFFWATPEQRRNLKLAATSLDRPYTDIVRQAFEFYEEIDEGFRYSREGLEPYLRLFSAVALWTQHFGEEGPPSLDEVERLITRDLSGKDADDENQGPRTAREEKVVRLVLSALRDKQNPFRGILLEAVGAADDYAKTRKQVEREQMSES